MKKCRVCKEPKDLLAFAKDKRAKDGYQSECRQCRANRYALKKQHTDEYIALSEEPKWYANYEVIVLSLIASYVIYEVLQ